MDIKEINRLFREKKKLLKPGAIEALKDFTDEEIKEIVEKLADLKTISISEFEIKEVTGQIKVPEFVEIKRFSDFHPTAKEYGHEFRVYEDHDITGKSKCKGEIEDFVKYFSDRYKRVKELFIARANTKYPITDIDKLSNTKPGDLVRLVVIVSKKIITKNKHVMLEVEDETGQTVVLVLNKEREGKEIYEKSMRIIHDEIIALDVRIGTNLNIVQDITWADMPFRDKKKIEKDISVAYISDIHVGSMHFLSKNFENMLKWLNGKGQKKELAEKVGYLVIGGDMVDGIGVYPNQDRELAIKDIYGQYKLLKQLLEFVPDHIQIIAVPGNHDSVRRAEPQPSLANDLFPEDGRTHSIGNPAYLNIEGFKTQIYHGYAMESLVQDIPGLTLAKPAEIAIELLKRRSLSPIFDKSMLAPEHKDLMFVEESDLFFTGHIHKVGYGEYRGCVIMNGGTWIDKTTAWQLRRGFSPTPAIMGVYDLHNGRVTHIDFSSGEIAFQ